MEYLLIITIYILICLPVANLGRNKKMGYNGALLLCLLTSPVIGAIICLCLPDEEVIEERYCKHCNYFIVGDAIYCPKCSMDNDGYTREQNVERFKKK